MGLLEICQPVLGDSIDDRSIPDGGGRTGPEPCAGDACDDGCWVALLGLWSFVQLVYSHSKGGVQMSSTAA